VEGGVQAFATKLNLATRISNVDISCDICGAVKEYDVHVLFLCPLAMEVWHEEELRQGCVSSALDMVGKVAAVLSLDRLGEFVAVMWKCWNSQNRFLFRKKEGWRGGLAHRAITFVHNFQSNEGDKLGLPVGKDSTNMGTTE